MMNINKFVVEIAALVLTIFAGYEIIAALQSAI
ncbi:hypothetical protein SAMN04488696_1481 [Methanolobus profundi]|uniref:Uncharacterized protein n=1 Tax=Methanolobus profundi TaxID=487685 RepID=A0A1I4RBD5_9EURY|nr:hypothetical protein SAMN04488696_1481 [Methanolobus profundi]